MNELEADLEKLKAEIYDLRTRSPMYYIPSRELLTKYGVPIVGLLYLERAIETEIFERLVLKNG